MDTARIIGSADFATSSEKLPSAQRRWVLGLHIQMAEFFKHGSTHMIV